MPIRIGEVQGEVTFDYESPFLGPVDHQAPVEVDITGLTNKEIDKKGYLKPGVPLTRDGLLVDYGDELYGVTIEETKLIADNESGTIAAATTPVIVAVCTNGAVKRKVAEDMLERAYTADEIAAFQRSNLTLLY